MADIFGYSRSGASGVFTAEKSTLSITGIEGAKDLIQSWSIQYSQRIDPIYEIGSARVYWTKGTPIGQGSIGRIVGNALMKMSTDVCDGGQTLKIDAATGCDSVRGKATLTCSGAVCTSVGFQSQVGNPTISQSVTFQFASLKY